MQSKPVIFIFGLGYVGVRLGQMLADKGWHIKGTTRNPAKLSNQADAGWDIFPFSPDRPLTDPEVALQDVDAILTTITAVNGTDPVLDAHGDVLQTYNGWSGYISATSVYPDQPEGFCFEDTPTDPATERGKARVIAEQRWLTMLDAEVFRVAGIYGPGRSPFDGLRNGTARIITRDGQLFNRIHLEDICRIIVAAIERPRPRRIVNLADKKPAPQGDVVRYAASLINVPPPEPQTLEQANLSPMARSFYVSRRKVGSRVIKPELELDLLYPDYESGLRAILDAEQMDKTKHS